MKKLITLLFVFISITAWSQKALPEDVQVSIQKRLEYGKSPSYAIGIVDKDGVRYYNFGAKTIGGAPVDEHSIYEIGSISKVFTAILLAQKVLEGKMKLDDPIKKYLPADVKVPQRGATEITLGNLSDHTSALPRMPSNFAPANPANPYADYTVKQMYEFLSGYELTRDIGSQYEYSNYAQGLLGHILATQSGTSYENLMVKNIASPLDMKETKITLDEVMKKNLAMGYSGDKQVENWDLSTLAGAGGIRSSTSDMLKFLSACMGKKKTSLRKAMDLTLQIRHDKANGSRVGLGWHMVKTTLGDAVCHSGGTGGYRTFAGFIQETGMGVVVFTNSDQGSPEDIGFHLLNAALPLKEVKASIAAEMKKVIDTKGVDEAITLYQERKKTKPDQYDFSEEVLNTLGYSYMDSNLPVAMAILKLNVEQFPDAFNVYDSYGEVLLKMAIQNYKKSVELNPSNASGIAALEKIGEKLTPAEVVVSEATLDTYLGVYELQPGFSITIIRDGKNLFAQATGQASFEVFPKSQTEFYYKAVEAQITFNVVDGKVNSLTLHQAGRKMNAKRVVK
jgi:D-alanyl-D-alanine-carboxypeptidase/D-alanyl-D-alanine-endopeptidase